MSLIANRSRSTATIRGVASPVTSWDWSRISSTPPTAASVIPAIVIATSR
jgi:hypothetical protein